MSNQLAVLDPETVSELAYSYRQQIREGHELGRKSDDELKRFCVSNIGVKRNTAMLIVAAKVNLKPDEFKIATDCLNENEIKGYTRIIKAAQLIEDPNVGLPQLLPMVAVGAMLTGSIPMPSGHGPQQLHESNFHSRFIKLTQTLMGDVNQELKDHPLTSLRNDQLISMAAATEPIAELYRQIQELINTGNFK